MEKSAVGRSALPDPAPFAERFRIGLVIWSAPILGGFRGGVLPGFFADSASAIEISAIASIVS
jgi:hypothetical protein